MKSESEIQLEAWHETFGTNQLTHALARLETAEKSRIRAEQIKSMSDSEMRLQFGEMSASEIRLVRAIINTVLAMPNDRHTINKEVIAKILKVEKYPYGSGYNFSKYETKSKK